VKLALPLRHGQPRARRRDRRVIDHRIELDGGSRAPRNARRAIAETMRGRRDLPSVRDVQLLVSELVTNSVLHGGAGPAEKIDLNVTLFPYVVRVVVADPLGGFAPRLAVAGQDRSGARGLQIIEALASRWGVRPGGWRGVCYEVGQTR
jgi:hypothetical protein